MIAVLLAGDGRGLLELMPLYHELEQSGLSARIVYVGGEVSARMRTAALRELGGVEPDLTLGVNEDADPSAIAKVVQAFKAYLEDTRPDVLVITSDTDASMACCLAAAKDGIAIARVDAGRRGITSSSREVNHVIIDRLASHHFVSDPEAMADLLKEGVPKKSAFFVGNLLTDVFARLQDPGRSERMMSAFNLKGQPYAAVYLERHRSDTSVALEMLQLLADQIQVVRLVDSKRLFAESETPLPQLPGVRVVDTESVRELLILLENAKVVVTDANMVQEAAAYFEVPCLTVGRPVERQVMVTAGCNRAVPFDPEPVSRRAAALVASPPECTRPPLWDGEVASRIVEILVRGYGQRLAQWISEYFVESHRSRKEPVS